MRIFNFVVAVFAAFSVCSADKLDLSGVPWTGAAYFWTWDGKRLPVKNRNLFGKEISIGGVKYKKGLAGHTGFSVVYNLSGQALRFTALAGIDDQAHPRELKNIKESSVVVRVLVDRKKVFEKTVKLGERAVPIDIDLKGRHQLEIRGEYGRKGFQKQRIVFANPVIEVENKEAFLKTAADWRDKVEREKNISIVYPPAPKWSNLKIEKKPFDGWENAYWIKNGKCELVIVPEFGGRIMSFGLPGGKNILSNNVKFNKNDMMKRGYGFTAGGHFTRPQPLNYFIPCDPILLFSKYTIEFPAEGEIILTSPASWYLWLRYRYKIKINANESGVGIVDIHKNLAPFENGVGVWSITRVNSSMVKMIQMPPEASSPPKQAEFSPKSLLPMIEISPFGWQSFSVTKELLKSFGTRKAMQWREYPTVDAIKVIFDDCVFTKTFKLSKDDLKNMNDLYPAHVYLCKGFLEVEAHQPVRKLACGESARLSEHWTLNVAGKKKEEHVRK